MFRSLLPSSLVCALIASGCGATPATADSTENISATSTRHFGPLAENTGIATALAADGTLYVVAKFASDASFESAPVPSGPALVIVRPDGEVLAEPMFRSIPMDLVALGNGTLFYSDDVGQLFMKRPGTSWAVPTLAPQSEAGHSPNYRLAATTDHAFVLGYGLRPQAGEPGLSCRSERDASQAEGTAARDQPSPYVAKLDASGACLVRTWLPDGWYDQISASADRVFAFGGERRVMLAGDGTSVWSRALEDGESDDYGAVNNGGTAFVSTAQGLVRIDAHGAENAVELGGSEPFQVLGISQRGNPMLVDFPVSSLVEAMPNRQASALRLSLPVAEPRWHANANAALLTGIEGDGSDSPSGVAIQF